MMFWKNKKNIFIFTFVAMVFFGILLAMGLVHAQSNQLNLGLQPIEQNIGLGTTDIRLIIARVIRAVLGLLGIIAICIMLWGGYMWMTSAGSEEKIGEAKKILINGTIGLVIILSAFSIAQFIINKLAGATGANTGDVSVKCSDPAYFKENPVECADFDICVDNPQVCCEDEMKQKDLFVALSITANTKDTKMNNVAARAIFNLPISNQFSADGVIKILQGAEDITNKFDFKFITNSSSQKIGVEASFKAANGVCSDNTTTCLAGGDYKVTVNDQLKSESGKLITTGTVECPYPMSVDFSIAHKNKLVLNFDGKNDYLDFGKNPLKDGSLTIEAWIYPTSKDHGFIVASDSDRYTLLSQNGWIKFRLAGVHGKNPDGTIKEEFCDQVLYGVPQNKWGHVVATYDDKTKEQTIYYNGNKGPSGLGKFNCGTVNGGALEVGGYKTTTGQMETWHFPGKISGVCLYNSSLDATAIKAHFDEGLGSCGQPGDGGLVAGWQLDDARPDKVIDYTGGGLDGVLHGGPTWELVPFIPASPAAKKQKDSAAPLAGKISVKTNNGNEVEKVSSGRLYFVASQFTDNSGIGYSRVTMERKESNGQKSQEVDYFNGPPVARVGGSDAPLDNPYLFKYPWVVQKVEDKSVIYEITVDVWDIDHNHSSTSTILMAVPNHCSNGKQDFDKGETGVDSGGPCGDGLPGSACVVDAQCSCGKCVNNICVLQPKILDISPMDGAAGNWLTIMGKCFGNETGKVEFGYDSNNDGSITESDIWSLAKKVDCDKDETWNDEWVIVEVPPDSITGQPGQGLPKNVSSSIRISHINSTPKNPVLDYSTDNFGSKPGKNQDGLFFKNDIKRPGLCSVKAEIKSAGGLIQWVSYGYPGIAARAKGSGFGKNGKIEFGGLQAPVDSWAETVILTKVPDNIQNGKVSVFVTSGGQSSNGVPFTVKGQSDLEKSIPVIDRIDPASSTARSYVTIYGHGFGNEKGQIYLAGTMADALNCASGAKNNCKELDVNLPDTCGGNTWQDTQVIAIVPSGDVIGDYFLILKNKIGLNSTGDDRFTIKTGEPMPSVCKITPSHGPAPLPSGEFLNLSGANFASTQGITYAYFWTKGANPQDTVGWLRLSTDESSNIFNVLDKGQIVSTTIPINETGLSMQTGPIKIKANGVVGNSIKYTVEDCRQASLLLQGEMAGKKFRCCEADGPDLGLWKSEGLACAGEVREAGYVWRFTTGKIRQLPFVIEHCDEVDWNDLKHPPTFPSPVPSILWKKGKEACLNAEIAVKFNVPMDSGTLNEQNVKLFTCAESGAGNSANCKIEKDLVDYEIDPTLLNGMYINPTSGLQPNTWYHVELSKDILSQDCGQSVAGTITKCFKDNLQVTKSCGIGTAYCFDFKTGTANCTLKDAGIEPALYTTNFLGKILNPSFPFDSQPEHPLYYLLWGRATQECTVMNVDGMGWQWASTDETKATVAPSITEKYKDSRAEVSAWKEAVAPNPVFITAHADELKISTSTTSTIKQSFTATSTLYIDLYPPKVTMWWPNCAEACINANVGAKFSRPMYQPSFDGNIKLSQCSDELCDNLTPLTPVDGVDGNDGWIFDKEASTDQIIRMKPANYFAVLSPNTWYLVEITGGEEGVHALGYIPLSGESVEEKDKGKPMAEDFSWKFRTRVDDSPCKADKVTINPDPYIATMIGQKTKYVSLPMALTAECGGPQGQELNPWVFGWIWKSEDPNKSATKDVASVSHFHSASTTNQFCGSDCTLLGSDVGRDETSPFLCGNGKVEPGEDCDIAAKIPDLKTNESVGVSCGLNCLRPGNTNTTTCGNNTVENNLGEECEPPGSQYCTANCLNTGVSSMLPAKNTTTTSWCGSGKVTRGEECDIHLTTSTNQSKIGCSDMCLHIGTPLAQSWCDDNPDIGQCKQAVSVCGNGEVESGEECDENSDYCNKNCLVHDICGINNNQIWDINGLRCKKDQEGCNPDCTLAGSSILYSAPSLCRDGDTNGIGEYPGCEVVSGDLYKVENPVQLVTAIGLGEVNPTTKSQKTTIEATLDHYYFAKTKDFVKLPDAGKTTGSGAYELKCGYNEYKKPVLKDNNKYEFNDCPDQAASSTAQGVANNSCCYDRPVRSAEYPVDGAGMSADTEAVCRNTFINIKFANRFIDEKTLSGNLVIAHGHIDPKYNCSLAGEINVNSLVSSTLALQTIPIESGGFWHNLWHKVKGWLVRITGGETFASDYNEVNAIKVWCSGSITAKSSLYYEWKNDYSAVTTTVALYLDKLLPSSTIMAVIMLGGSDGIKDTQGISIRNPDDKVLQLADAWYFMTGNKVCKLTDVTVEPNKWLFQKPQATSTFHAVTHSTNGQQIVPIQGQYFWTWDWQPDTDANDIFDIPKLVLDNTTTTIVIGARNVEGNKIAVANAHVLQDVDKENNQVGKTFTGITNLTAMFCENPWPQPNYFPFEDGLGFGKNLNTSGFNASSTFDGSALPAVNGEYFNFRMSYCADAGQSGTTTDDLPYLKPMLFTATTTYQITQLKHCQVRPTSGGSPGVFVATTTNASQLLCQANNDCLKFYNLPHANSDKFTPYSASCPNGADLNTLIQNNCLLHTFLDKNASAQAVGFCRKNDPVTFPPVYGSPYKSCKINADCDETIGEVCWLNISNWAVNNSCIDPGEKTVNGQNKFLVDKTFKRYVFVNDVNDDIIGIQIFDNSDRLDVASWIKDKFPNLSGLKKNSVKGYEAVSDGQNYYINALNEAEYGGEPDLKNRIYLFSINKDAQGPTLNVFNRLVSSLEFNINISDFGYCMVNNPIGQNITKLPFGELQSQINDDIGCVNDFECRDSVGLPLAGTNGICSNAKTKLQRDLLRLIDYQTIQTKMSLYMDSHAKKAPELKSGTYLSGYTVSKWPSWGKLGSEVNSGLPTDKINKWNGCDKKADQLTCWDTASSTYYCPNYAQVYEYEYTSSTQKYKLHGPLEYLTPGMSLVKKQVNLNYFTTEPWCEPNQSHNMSVGLCGNGVVNKSEECDPFGSTMISEAGMIFQPASAGECAGGFASFKKDDVCLVNIDCGYKWMTFAGQTALSEKTTGLCAVDNALIYDYNKFDFNRPNELIGVPCESRIAQDCQEQNDYPSSVAYGTADVYARSPSAGQKPLTELLADSRLRCVTTQDKTTGIRPEDFFVPSTLAKSASDCVGATPANSVKGVCLDNTKAVKTCSSQCKWLTGSCLPIWKCGNGLVEPGETCDDGGLNGAYGHCPVGCKGDIAAFCGDGKINTSTFGGKINNLELCDKAEAVYTKGFCKVSPLFACSDKLGLLCGDLGPCVSQEDPSYDFVKDRTCSWDCQKRAGYCGDGIEQDLEECDDANKVDLDGCNKFCYKENFACKNSGLSFATSTNPTDLSTFYISKMADVGMNPVAECMENSNGAQICRAFGLECNNVMWLKNQIASPDDYGEVDNDPAKDSCREDLTPILGNDHDYKYVVNCDGIYNGPQPIAPTTPDEEVAEEHYCGNQVVETYKDADDKEIKEVCDMGPTKNGIACTPKYGKTCSYCSPDCKEILTVSPVAYCGNNVVEFTSLDNLQNLVYEKCEVKEDGKIWGFDKIVSTTVVWGLPGWSFWPMPTSTPTSFEMLLVSSSPKICPDKGSYTCTNNCTSLNDNCVDCRLDPTVGASYKNPVLPGINVVNVLNPAGIKFNWPLGWPLDAAPSSFAKLIYQDGGHIKLKAPTSWPYPVYIKNNSSSTQLFGFEIEGNSMCNKPGGSYVVQFGDATSSNIEDLEPLEVFDFPVHSVPQGENLINEYVISPVPVTADYSSVKTDMIRIVARWTDEEDALAQFKVILQNDSLGQDKFFDYFVAQKAGKLGSYGFYPNGKRYDQNTEIYFSPAGGSKKNMVQAVTMDYGSFGGTFRVLVEAVGMPIAYFKNKNLQVEVYLSKPGQNLLKIYQPDKVFNISTAADKSSNDDAVEWYVFDFKKEGTEWKINPVEQIKTSWCYIINPNNSLDCAQQP